MKILYSFLLVFCSLSIFSQGSTPEKCGHDDIMAAYEKEHPGYEQKIQESFNAFKKNKKSDKRLNITIPIHVIIVHPPGQPIGTGSNHSLAHVQSQIDVLNEDFGRYNSDAGNTPPEFPAADTGIQFCLASVDPDGNPTDGITRYEFSGNFLSNAIVIRGETRWPRESYANIWSAANLPYLGAVGALPTTFALPSIDDDYIDVDAATFGGPGFGTEPNYNLGRTTTHEMGHWLGLRHVWGNFGGCSNDDNISDTPIQNNSNGGCPSHPSPSCGNSGDMFMNYMDYVNDNCMNAFTQEQGDYMNSILSTSRASLNGSSFTACATVVPLVLTVTSMEDPTCSDTNNGFILVEASGGNPGYSYSIDGGVPTTNNLFTDLSGGTYSIEAFDSDGNSAIVTVFLDTPVPLTTNINITQTNSCPNDMNGAIEIQIAGGSNPYIYSLNMGMTQSSNTFENLSNGFYVANIEDNNGCTLEEIFELSSTSGEIEITIDSTENLICGNDNMGLIIASAEGGNGPLSYSLNGFDFQDDGEFLELDGGAYYVYVQDSLGCYDSLEVILTEPDPFFLSVQSNDVTCFGYNDGSLDVSAMGGNGGPYQFSFDSINFGDATMLDSLFAGEYDLFALDSLGCMASATFDIDEPDEVQILTDTIINVDCFGESTGAVNFSATGGSEQYTFIFQGDSTSTGNFENLSAGVYDITVVDSNGCEGSSTFEIGINSTIGIDISNEVMPSCPGQSDGLITVSATNTQGAVMYSINGGTQQESPIFSGLSAGDYQIIVQDGSGCNAAININLGEPEEISVLFEVNHVLCFDGNDGNVNIVPAGGSPPYQFAFESADIDLTQLTAGIYSVTITDDNDCATSSEFTISQPDALELTIITQVGADCDTGLGALLEFEASGGNENYNFTIDGPSGLISNNDGVFDQLVYGQHEAKVTDANGCETQLDVFVTLENMFYAEISSITDILCFSENGGAIDLNIQGGQGNFTYLLDAATDVDPNNLDTHAGEHTLSIVDENDCTIELLFTLDEPEELVIDSSVIDFDPFTLTVYASGGVEPYLYSFDGGPFTDNNVTEDLGASIITVIVQDANGCEVEQSFGIDGVNDIAENWGVNAFPNPFQEELSIELNFPSQITASIEVFDIDGRLVHNILAKKYNSGENFVKIDLRNFASSIYIVKIASAKGYRYIKATKM